MQNHRTLKYQCLAFAFVGLFSFFWSIFFQFRVLPCRLTFALDSGHYLYTAAGLLASLHSHGGSGAAPASIINDVMIDGPILPLLVALALLCSRTAAEGTAWPYVTALMSLANGVASGGVTALILRQGRSLQAALTAGLAWAIYPAVVFSSGRLLTEPPAVALLVLLTLVSASISSSSGRKFILGMTAGVLAAAGFLLKPVLIVLWIGIPLLALVIALQAPTVPVKQLRPISVLLGFFCGILTLMVPWLLFGLANGHPCIAPQRVPSFNVAKGQDLTADGWAVEPVPETTAAYDRMGPVLTMKTAWSNNPLGMAGLYLRKLSRTVGFQWNDFHQYIYGMSPQLQNIFHGALLVLAVCGSLIVFLFRGSEKADFISIVALAAFAVQALIYLPFESITRYGYCATPFMAILACLLLSKVRRPGLVLLIAVLITVALEFVCFEDLIPAAGIAVVSMITLCWRLLWLSCGAYCIVGNRLKINSPSGALFLLLVLLPAVVLALRPEEYDRLITIKSNQQFSRSLLLPAKADRRGSYFLLLDCGPEPLDCFLNGERLAPCIPLNKINCSHYALYNLQRIYTAITDHSVDSMRQWRLLPVPRQALRFGAENSIVIRPVGSRILLGADYLEGSRVSIPASHFSAGYFCNGNRRLESRLKEYRPLEVNAGRFSLDDKAMPSTLMPRIYLACAGANSEIRTPVSLAEPFHARFLPSCFDPACVTAGDAQALTVNRYTFQIAGPARIERDLPGSLSEWPIWKVRLSGRLRSVGRADKVGVMVTVATKESNSFMALPAFSPFLQCSSKEWSRFQIEDVFSSRVLVQGPKTISLSIWPGRWEQLAQYGLDNKVGSFQFKDLELVVEPFRFPALSGDQLTLY